MGYKLTPIDGDVAVGRDAEIGGDVDIQGNGKIRGTLKVEGFLDAPHIKGSEKGLFLNEEELNKAYPNPRVGWFAIVQDSDDEIKGFIYIARERQWEKISKESHPFEFIMDSINVYASKRELNDETTRATEAENNIKSQALQTDTVHFSQGASGVSLGGRSVDGKSVVDKLIPVATTEKPGVMSPEDKVQILNNKKDIENTNIDIEELKAVLADGSFVVGIANLANAVKDGAVTFEMLDEHLKLSVSVVDNLETANTLMPLSANQGKVLKELIDVINGTGEGSTDKKIADAIALLVDSAPENLDTLRELAEWTEKHGTEFAGVVADINKIKNDALLTDSVHVSKYAEKINIGGRSLDGSIIMSVDIPSATSEKAGVMSAEQVKTLQAHNENLANLNTTILNYNRKIGNYAPVDKASVVANLGTAVERGMVVTYYSTDGWKSIRYISPQATAEAFANVDNWKDVDDFSAEDTETVVENIEETLVTNALRKTPQVLSDAEKAQVRDNIGATSDKELSDQKKLILKADSLAFETVGNSLLLQGESYGGNNISIPIPAATTENAGVMSAEDKEKLDSHSIDTGNYKISFHTIVGTHPYGRFFLKKNYNYRFVFTETGYTSSLYKVLKNPLDDSILVASTTGGEFSYSPTEDIEAYLTLYSGSEGDVTVAVTSLSVVQKEIADNLGFEAMPVIPTVIKGKYTKYETGTPTDTGFYFTQYCYAVSGLVDRIVKVNSYSPDINGAVVAFYSSVVASADSYLKEMSVQATGGYEVVDITIPEGAVIMVVTHRNADDFTKPMVLLKGLVEEPSTAMTAAAVAALNDVKVTPSCEYSTSGYIKFSDGSLVSTGSYWKYAKVDVRGLKDVEVTGKWYDTAAAAIAFYTEDGAYLKDFSVAGVAGEGLTFKAAVPTNAAYAICSSAELVPIIRTHSVGAVVDSLPTRLIEPLKALYNPFVGKPLYHHLNQEQVSAIPAQSLYDIAYAKALGFSVIEANVQRCADGVFVTKHGNSGKLGTGLVFAKGSGINADTTFNSLTSEQLRANVTYDTPLPQYAGHIPTLDEFCAECKRFGMKILLQVIDDEVLRIARTYFPDSDIIAYDMKSRGDFNGLITTFQSVDDSTTVDGVLSVCESFGKPYVFGGFWSSSMSDDKVREIVSALHKNGYLAGAAYADTLAIRRLAGLGVDMFASMADVNLFDAGNVNNVFSFDKFDVEFGNVTLENGVANMSQGSVLSLSDAAFENNHGKLLVSLLFDGELNVKFGNIKDYTVASDGTAWVTIARVIGRNNKVVGFEAKTDTVIKGVKVLSSVVI